MTYTGLYNVYVDELGNFTRFAPAGTPANSVHWSLLGNTGTADETNFIGTTDNIPLTFKVNSQVSGKIDHLKFNAFFGYQSGFSNTTGQNNVFIGHTAGRSTTTGNNNTASGVSVTLF